MILIDPPRWPAHGTHFGHLVSDDSLAELMAFVRLAGLPLRSFDHDHVDVPAERYDEFVALGAVPVPSRELVRRLHASGLRVRPGERTPKRAWVTPHLRASWAAVSHRGDEMREDLLARWAEPHRGYHDVRHLWHVLSTLTAWGVSDRRVLLAAWFHDAVYAGRPDDEEASASLAEAMLTGRLPRPEVAEVARLVRLTATHDPDPDDHLGAALVDADLAILAVPAGRYHVYLRDVRWEYAHLDEATFRAGRLAVVAGLLGRRPLYRTPLAQPWARTAEANLLSETTVWG